MLAREFAARAGTLERNVIQVYHRLVGILSASLAMTPDGTSAAFPQYHLLKVASPLPAFTDESSGASCNICSSVKFNGIRNKLIGHW